MVKTSKLKSVTFKTHNFIPEKKIRKWQRWPLLAHNLFLNGSHLTSPLHYAMKTIYDGSLTIMDMHTSMALI